MIQALSIIKLILELLPSIITAIKGIEVLLPENGEGATKLELIRVTLENTYGTASGLTVQFENLWPVLKSVISGIVGVFNKSGVFLSSK